MKDRISKLPSPALVVAMVALVAALGGVAAALPGRNTVDKNDIKKNAVRAKNIKKNAVTTPKIKNGAVTTPKLGDGAVSRAKVANDAIDSSKVAADSLTAADLAPGVVSVVAYGRVNNPNPGPPTLGAGAVGLTGVSGGSDGLGRTTVTVDAAVLPGGDVSTCSVQATPAAAAQPNEDNSLGFDTVTVATGPPAPATAVQAQTRGAGEVLNDFDYFVQVTCPGV